MRRPSILAAMVRFSGQASTQSTTMQRERRCHMRRRLVTTLAAAALLAGSTRAQDAAAVIAAASRAIGVDSLKTVEFTASGYDFALGQAPNPSSPWPKFI